MQDIHDIRSPIQVGMDFSWIIPALIGLAVVLILMLLFVLIRKRLQNRNIKDSVKLLPEPLTPYDAALQALAALSENAKNNLRMFYFDLTLLLRKYIGATYQIHAVEMTSQQFLSCLRKLDLEEKQKSRIAEFYKNCDPYKYAGIVPGPSQIQSDLEMVKDMITRIESQVENQLNTQIENRAGNLHTPNDDMQKGEN